MRRPMVVGLLFVVAASCAFMVFSASAFAESPWWHLSSGARPAHLHVAGGASEVQEIVTEAGDGFGFHGTNFVLTIPTGSSSEPTVFVGEFASEPISKEAGVTLASAANIQAALEKPNAYGPGNVTVKAESTDRDGKPLEPGQERYIVDSVGAASETAVLPLEGTKEIGTIITRVPRAGYAQELDVSATNVGDGDVQGAESPVAFTDVLPKGLKATGVAGTRTSKTFNQRDQISCALSEVGGRQVARCNFSGSLVPYSSIEMRISVTVEPTAENGEDNEVAISGGGAPPVSVTRPVTISSAPVPFGVEEYEMSLEEEGGAPTTQAGAHPFQLTTAIQLNQLADINPLVSEPLHLAEVAPAGLAKDLHFKLPPGLIGNPSAIPQCTIAEFYQTKVGDIGGINACPQDTTIGVAVVTVHEPTNSGTATFTLPVFNVEPAVGEPARFGFYVALANSPVLIDTALRNGSDYGVTVNVQNITQTGAFLSSVVTFWGTPGDPSHDHQRGWGCIAEQLNQRIRSRCVLSEEQNPKPFLSLPTSCTTAPQSSVEGVSWEGENAAFTQPFPPDAPLTGCNRLQFEPQIKVAPDGQEASKPTGLTVDVHVPQEANGNPAGLASSNVKDISVTFPKGVVLNPASADGLQACPENEAGLEAGLGAQGEMLFTPILGEPFCPDAAKVGTVTIKSPLLPKGQNVEGALYLAEPAPNGEPGKNPFNTLVAAYIIAKDPVSGTVVKLPGSVSLDPVTGQITSTFENNPQLAFEDAEIHLFGGERAPFATPAHCGSYTTEATFTPWSGTAPVRSTSTFQIISGPNGTPCPPAALPFGPSLAAGSPNINAGGFSPLTTTITRQDGDQNINKVQLHMAPGMSGILAGVPLCDEVDANAGTCPEASLIGHTIVSVGLGGDPFSVTGGKVYLTGKYEGAPFGLSIVNPAVAGPFDLGKVIVRARIEVDPHTAALTITTGEIPHILDGIPLQIKHVNVLIDRPGFTFNPTSCNPQAITGTIGSVEGASAPVSTAFQVTNCAALKFAPKFSVSTSGRNSKAHGASLTVKLTEPNGPQGSQANIARVKVELPKQLPSRLTTLQKACTAAQFDTNPAGCPAASIIGHAVVHTPLLPVALEGPAYFVSNGGEAFPNLIMVLQGYGVRVDLVGDTFISKAGITSSTFKTVPDVPFNTFELTLPQGPNSALATNVPAKANYSLCGQKLTMPTEFLAQNGGTPLTRSTPVTVTGCPKTKTFTRAQKLTLALKVCHKKHNYAKRNKCERAARKRYHAH